MRFGECFPLGFQVFLLTSDYHGRNGETAKRRNGAKTRPALSRFGRLPECACSWSGRLRTEQEIPVGRALCANGSNPTIVTIGLRQFAKAWRKRRYASAFVSKLSDAETEAAETQVHAEFAFRHDYLSCEEFLAIDDAYEKIVAQLVKMIDEPDKWLIKNSRCRL